jgi:hypothetical protein
MRFSDSVRNFGEIWANGFPDCMAIASKWFSTLFLDHVPEFEFDHHVEFEFVKGPGERRRDYLRIARRDSQHIYAMHHTSEETQQLEMKLKLKFLAPPLLTGEISDMSKITDNVRHINKCKQFGFFNSPYRSNNYLKVLELIEACTEQDLNDPNNSSSGVTSSEDSLASSLDSGSKLYTSNTLVAKKKKNVNIIPGSGGTSLKSVDSTDVSSSEDEDMQFKFG